MYVGSISVDLRMPLDWVEDVVEHLISIGEVRLLSNDEKYELNVPNDAMIVQVVGEKKISLAYD